MATTFPHSLYIINTLDSRGVFGSAIAFCAEGFALFISFIFHLEFAIPISPFILYSSSQNIMMFPIPFRNGAEVAYPFHSTPFLVLCYMSEIVSGSENQGVYEMKLLRGGYVTIRPCLATWVVYT